MNRLTFLVTATIAALMIACKGDESEPIPTSSIQGVTEPRSSVDESSSPGTATLEWDAVKDPAVRGYRVYYGPVKGMYLQLRGQGINAGNVTTYTVTGLVSQRRYYFAVTAYDASYEESDYSNEVFKDIP